MVSESDFIAAFQAYHDALEDPAAKIDTIRPLVNQHLEGLIVRLPGVTVQNAARQRAMVELDRIEEMTKEKSVDAAAEIKEFEEEVRNKTRIEESLLPTLFVEPENPDPFTPFTVGFSDASGDPSAWIGIYPTGAPHGEHGSNWLYVSGTNEMGEGRTAGSVTFGEGRPPGDFDARLFRNNGHELMASVTFTILAPEPPATIEDEPVDPLQDAFNVFDRDGKGTIDLIELGHMINAVSEMSPEEVGNVLNDYDADGDGVINFEEFKAIMAADLSRYTTPTKEAESEPIEVRSVEEPEQEESVSEPDVVISTLASSIADVVSHLDTLKLFGAKRRYIESLSDEVFDFTLKIEKMEKTIGIRLTDEFRGGETCIGMVDDIGVGVRMPNTMELSIGQEVFVEAKLLEYRSVVKRFEFEHL